MITSRSGSYRTGTYQQCQTAYWPSGEADGDGEAASSAAGDGDGDVSLFFAGEGDASEVDAFFFAGAGELEVVLVVPPVFLVVLEVVDFLVVAVEPCAVVAAVSSLCAHETTNAAPARTVMNPSTNFFIFNRYFRV